MEYLKVAWVHDYDRYEVRKVEVFRDGSMDFADAARNGLGRSRLDAVPTPSMEDMARDRHLRPEVILREEFEKIWRDAGAASDDGSL